MANRTVNEVSKLSGVSIRTLHYYDQIGLLPPTEIAENGYRLYDDTALERLQEILLPGARVVKHTHLLVKRRAGVDKI